MAKICFNKTRNVWCVDLIVNGQSKRHFFTYNKKDSTRRYKQLKTLLNAGVDDTLDAKVAGAHDVSEDNTFT